MSMSERLESVVSEGIVDDWPAKEIVRRILDELKKPSKEMIVQGCHALYGKERRLEAAEYSGDRYEKARMKMQFRWKAMIKAIQSGM